MKEKNSGSSSQNIKVGHYFVYDLDDRVIYSRFEDLGGELKIKGQTYPFTKVEPLAFGALISDRRVYNPGETIRLLVASPGAGNGSAHLEIMYAGKRAVISDDFSLDKYGVYLYELKGLDESGEYTATATVSAELKRGKTTKTEKKTFSCDFTLAEYTLSPMLARTKKQVISGDVLDAEFEISVLNQPYTGSMRVGLYCEYCKVVVEEKSFDAKSGSLKLQWKLSGHTGPFRLEFSTPDGNTASITLQSTRVEERQEIQISNLGQIVNVALIPIPDGRSTRGLNWAPRGVSTAPVEIKRVESDKIEVQVTRNLDYVYIHTSNPFTGETRRASKGSVKEGQQFSFSNSAPYQIVFVGCIVDAKERSVFEGRSVVFHPEALKVDVKAPEKAEPSDEITIRLLSNMKAQCLFMAYDERLDTENITGKLGKDIYNHLKALGDIEELEEQFAVQKEVVPDMVMMEEAPRPSTRMAITGTGMPVMKMAARAPPSMARPSAAPRGVGAIAAYSKVDEGSIATVIAAGMHEEMVVAPRRAWFPKLLVCKLVEIDGVHEEHIKLGDTITHWKVQVYAFAGPDCIAQSASIEADKSAVVDLDVPSMIDEGDEYYGKAIYHLAKGKGTLRVKLPDGSVYEGEIEGDGIKDFRLPGPGVIEAELTSPIGGDLIVKEVNPQVSERVTVSALSILEKGEEIEIRRGKKVFVYSSMKTLLSDSVRALVQYPYGCAEQTSAKLCGLAIAWDYGETSHEVTQMISTGLSRMTKFLQQDGLYSLWEGAKEGSPDVTRKVLKNLTPLTKVEAFKKEASPLVEKPVKELLKREVKDNSLLSLSEEFAAPISTVEDAANVATFTRDNAKRVEALRFIESRAVEGSGGSEAHWEPSQSTWGGTLEATATALRALAPSNEEKHRALFRKGFKFVTKRLVAGRLNSTADTRSLVELFASMKDFEARPKFVYTTYAKTDRSKPMTLTESDYKLDSPNVTRVASLDDEAGGDLSIEGRKLKAGSRLIVRIDGTETIEYKNIKSIFNFDAKLAKTTLKLGERVQLVVTPKDQTICPITKIFLAANTAFLEGGVNIQTISKPLTNGGITLDIVATSRGKCNLYTVMYDMYDANMIGVAMPIRIVAE